MSKPGAWRELLTWIGFILLLCPTLLTLSISVFLRRSPEDKHLWRFVIGYALQGVSLVASAAGYWLFHVLYDACPTCFIFWFPFVPVYWATLICGLGLAGFATVWQARKR